MSNIKDFRNPDTFFGRFLCHFTLAFSACLTAQLVLLAIGRFDIFMSAIWSFSFSILFELIRVQITHPGTRFWGSPFARSEKS